MTWPRSTGGASWVRDMDINDELLRTRCPSTDVTTFGRTIVGIDEFVTYNFVVLRRHPRLAL